MKLQTVSAQRLARLRKTLLLTQEEFSKILGISRPTLVRYEKTDPRLITREHEILKVFGINPLYIHGQHNIALDGYLIEDIQDALRKALDLNNK